MRSEMSERWLESYLTLPIRDQLNSITMCYGKG
jgi:hypothetical protein